MAICKENLFSNGKTPWKVFDFDATRERIAKIFESTNA